MDEQKCKYCAMMIPKDAKICPHCRKQLVWSLPAKIFIGFIALVIISTLIRQIKGTDVQKPSGKTQVQEEVTTQQPSVSYKEEKPAPQSNFTPPQGSISAKDLYNFYDVNEVAADEKFKGKRFVVYGEINSIHKNIADQPSVTLKAGTLSYVDCRFPKEQSSQLVSLQKGQMIAIEGTCNGKMVTSVFLHDCEQR